MLHHALIWTFMVMQAELLCKHNFDSELVLLRYPQSQLYLFNISRRVRAFLGISMNSKLFRKFFDETYNLVASITLHPSLCFVTTCILLLCRANVHSFSVNSANFIRLKLMESFCAFISLPHFIRTKYGIRSEYQTTSRFLSCIHAVFIAFISSSIFHICTFNRGV